MKVQNTYVVSIGISQYSNIKPLEYAAKDALNLAEVFCDDLSPNEIKVLLDAAATKPAILEALAWLAAKAGPSDTAIVYLSGHGGRKSVRVGGQAYFCPVNASPKNVQQTCIGSKELTTALRAIQAERLVLLLDSCYAGGLGSPRDTGDGLTNGLNEDELSPLVAGRGRVIMAASRPDEPAWNLDKMRNGLFTSYLLQGLQGAAARADGTVWVSDIFSYVSQGVRQHQNQHPYQKAIGEDFVICFNRHMMQTSDIIQPEIDLRSLRIALHSAYNLDEFSRLCRDLKLRPEDLPGRTLETQLMELIDHCQRHGRFSQLLEQVRIDRPHLVLQ